MKFTNSPLTDYVKISPNRYVNRKHEIDTITIHMVVGQASVESLGALFAKPSRRASSNYGVGFDGRIGLYCPERDHAWTSSNFNNDQRAVTIEVASDTTEPYAVTKVAYDSLIRLCADICKRNGIKELKWKDDPMLIGQPDKQNMTLHKWFAATNCPGTYLHEHMGDIAAKTNKILFGKALPNNTKDNEKKPNKTILDDEEIDEKDTSNFTPYLVRIIAHTLNIRKGPGTNYPIVGRIIDRGVYTIVEEKLGYGSVAGWGKLKSEAGWISLDWTRKY